MDAKWLTDFEKKVEAAAAELKKLRKENASQKTKIDQLQKDLKAAQDSGESAAEWEAEREELRQRVEKLSAALEDVLGATEPGKRTVFLKVDREAKAKYFEPAIEAISMAGGDLIHVLESQKEE